ncbi:uncharacterized protein LOC143807305 isoform X1 [Ranitomeya variabilis]|uniref:uncharacterized protein LOC143807305 isoform X1 n=1 Tax=Ranitomeya variabilis TaxID=490064 RepID=UPI004055C5D1
MTSIFHRAMRRSEPTDNSDMSSEEEPLLQSGPHDGSRINVIRNINTFARTKTLAQGFLDMALFTANASQMKHLLQQGPETPFYYFLFSLLDLCYISTCSFQDISCPPVTYSISATCSSFSRTSALCLPLPGCLQFTCGFQYLCFLSLVFQDFCFVSPYSFQDVSCLPAASSTSSTCP